MGKPDGQIIVWDPETGDDIEIVPIHLRAVQSDDAERIVLVLERKNLEDLEYGGAKFCIEISPSAVRSDETTAAILKVADELRMPVG